MLFSLEHADEMSALCSYSFNQLEFMYRFDQLAKVNVQGLVYTVKRDVFLLSKIYSLLSAVSNCLQLHAIYSYKTAHGSSFVLEFSFVCKHF